MVQLLCSIKLAVVALLYMAAQQSSKAKCAELWESRSSSTALSRSQVHGAEAAIPSAAPQAVLVCIHLHCLFQAWCLFSCLWRREGGEREIFVNVVLYLLFFVCLCSFSLESAQFLHSGAASRAREQAGLQQWPILLGFMEGRKDRVLLIKKLFRILEILLICSRIY